MNLWNPNWRSRLKLSIISLHNNEIKKIFTRSFSYKRPDFLDYEIQAAETPLLCKKDTGP